MSSEVPERDEMEYDTGDILIDPENTFEIWNVIDYVYSHLNEEWEYLLVSETYKDHPLKQKAARDFIEDRWQRVRCPECHSVADMVYFSGGVVFECPEDCLIHQFRIDLDESETVGGPEEPSETDDESDNDSFRDIAEIFGCSEAEAREMVERAFREPINAGSSDSVVAGGSE